MFLFINKVIHIYIMKQNGKNDYNEIDLQVKEHNNKIAFVNDTVNKIICSIVFQLSNK